MRSMALTGLALSVFLFSVGNAQAATASWNVESTWGAVDHITAADFDGDGLADIASPFGSTVYMKRSTGNSFINEAWPAGSNWSPSGITVAGDFNGDRRVDLASANAGTVYIKLNNGTGSLHFDEVAWSVASSWGAAGYTFAGDFNGDGKADIASASGGSVFMKLSTGSGFTSATWPVSNQWGAAGYTFAGDFNGDGKTDLASASGGTAFMKLSTGSGFTSVTWAISNQWGSAGYPVAADFNGDGRADIASPNGGQVYVKLSTGSGFTPQTLSFGNLWGGNGWSFAGDFNADGLADIASPNGTTVHMKLSDPPIAADAQATQGTYYVRVGDINGDGQRDLLVTGSGQRAVGDFILQGFLGGVFQILTNATPAQLQAASLWPVSNIAVSREDLNFDGYFDFVVENIAEIVPGAPDVLIYTTRNSGSAPVKLVTMGSTFKRTLEQVERFLKEPQAVMGGWSGSTCFTTSVPVVYPNTIVTYINGGYPWGNYWDSYYGIPTFFPSVTFIPVTYCPLPAGFETKVNQLLTARGPQFFNALTQPNAGDVTTQQAANAGYAVVIAAGAAITLRASLVLTGILIADDVTVVGAIDDVFISVTAIVAGTAYVVYIAANVIANSNNYDLGPTTVATPQAGTGDPFNLPPGCQPNDPARTGTQVLAGGRAGSSKRLGENLKKMGCDKPHADAQAHHIVPKDSNSIPAMNSRALLRELGIDIDEAANGVWLPKNQNIVTNARAHLGRGMHSFRYEERVFTRLLNARNAGGGNAVRAELDLIRQELLNNTFVF